MDIRSKMEEEEDPMARKGKNYSVTFVCELFL